MLVVGECASNGRSVSAMSREEKIVEAMRRSAPLLPSELGQAVESLLTPETAFLIGGTLGAWAVSHIFGIGEILDLLLLVVGVVTLGKSAWDLAHLLRDFAATALAARTNPDLARAAQLFARAVVLGGLDVVMALLLRRDLKTVKAKFGQGYSIRPSLLQTAPPPRAPPGAAFYRPRISRPPLISGGRLGYCEWYGDIFVSRAQSIVEQRITLYHEWVHSILKPKFVPLRQLRMNLTASGYWRVAFLRYLEETMAEA